MLVGSAIFYVMHFRLYPVALVGSQAIFADQFYRVADSAFKFYLNASEVYQKKLPSKSDAEKLYSDIKRATLDRFVEDGIFNRELAARFGASAANLVDKKLANVDNDKLKAGVAQLYGLTMQEFKKMVLEPEAEREILIENFQSKNENFDMWLASAKSKVGVTVLMPGIK